MTLRTLPVPAGAEAYLAFDKPAGQAVHGGGGLLEEARRALGDDLHLVHRLDRITSGLLLLARGEEALRAAHAAWPSRVTKSYLALVRGLPDAAEGFVDLPLLEHRTGKPWLLERAVRAAYGPDRAARLLRGEGLSGIPPLPPLPPPARCAAHPAGRPALTRWRLLERRGEDALLELTPETGRMHQLRVHLAAIGHPLRNDPIYDPARDAAGEPPLLRSVRIAWEGPPGDPAGTWTFEASASEMIPA